MSQDTINDQLVLICGKSATGKSASLMGIKNQDRVMYLNCESGKRLPFRNKFKSYTITDPMQVLEAFDHAKENPDIDVVVVDSLTYLLDMYESIYLFRKGLKWLKVSATSDRDLIMVNKLKRTNGIAIVGRAYKNGNISYKGKKYRPKGDGSGEMIPY